MRKLLYAFLIIFFVINCWANAELLDADLSMLTKNQLESLIADIKEEIELNHTIGSEKYKVQDAVEEAVEAFYQKKDIEVSWALFNDEYSCDWDFYTYKNDLTYHDATNKKRRERVYAELQYVDDEYEVFYVSVGKEVIIDNHANMPKTKWTTLPNGVYNEDTNLDLSKASVEDLNALKKQIEKEINDNHTPSSNGRQKCLEVTKAAVEEHLSDMQVELSWPWFDYEYTCDWDYYSLSTSVEYKSESIKRTGLKIYSETYLVDDEVQVILLLLNNKVIIDTREDLIATDPVKKMVSVALMKTGYRIDDGDTVKPTSANEANSVQITEPNKTSSTNEPSVTQNTTAAPTDTPKPADTPKPTDTPAPTEDPTQYVLKRGDKNEDVRQLQKRLIELGYLNDSADGDFGPKTENAVIAYQKAAGLTASGVCDYNTFKSINSQNAPAAPKPTATPKPTNKPSSSGSNKNSGSSGSSGGSYIGNKNTKKFHHSWCSSVGKMKSSNKVSFSSRSAAISKGYDPCKNCNP